MWMDAENLFSDGQAITATAISANVIDTKYAGTVPLQDIGAGRQPLYLVVQATVAFTLLTSLTVTLESDDNVGLTSSRVHFSSGAIALAALTAGATLVVVPLPLSLYERYIGLRYTVAGTNPGAGTIDAFLTTDPQRWAAYRSGTVV